VSFGSWFEIGIKSEYCPFSLNLCPTKELRKRWENSEFQFIFRPWKRQRKTDFWGIRRNLEESAWFLWNPQESFGILRLSGDFRGFPDFPLRQADSSGILINPRERADFGGFLTLQQNKTYFRELRLILSCIYHSQDLYMYQNYLYYIYHLSTYMI